MHPALNGTAWCLGRSRGAPAHSSLSRRFAQVRTFCDLIHQALNVEVSCQQTDMSDSSRGLAVAVCAGALRPDISSVEAFTGKPLSVAHADGADRCGARRT